MNEADEKLVREICEKFEPGEDALREAIATERDRMQQWAAHYIISIAFTARAIPAEVQDVNSVEDCILAVIDSAIRLTRESDVKTLSDFRDEVRVVNTYRNRIGQHTQFALDSLSDAIEKVRRLSREGK